MDPARHRSGLSPRYVNAWFTAHDRAGDLAGYLRDVQLAWQLAQTATRRELATGGVAPSLGVETRYALITASLVSLATSLPLPLIIALTTHRRWPHAQALAYIRQLPDPADRAFGLTAVLPVLPPTSKTRCPARR